MKKLFIFISIFLLTQAMCNATNDFPHGKKGKGERLQTLPDSILNYGMTFLNTPYHYGSPGPKTFDCSGFTSYVYSHFGYELPRTSRQQAVDTKTIKKDKLQKGDLVFFQGRRRNGVIGHVGIILEKNDDVFKFLHASIGGVKVSSSDQPYYASRFVQGGRVLTGKEQLLIEDELDKIEKNTTILTTNNDSEYIIHTVKRGESLSKIAKKYDIPVATLKTMNALKSNRIKKGMKLKVGEIIDDIDDAGDEDEPMPVENNLNEEKPLVATSTRNSSPKSTTKKENTNSKKTVEKPIQNTDIAQTKTATTTKDSVYYTVMGGETLYSIAKKHNLPVNKLKEINRLKSDNLTAGQKLKISSENIATVTEDANNSSTQKTQYHTVIKGESLYFIHKKYGCSIDDIKKWNNLPDNQLKIGQKLVMYF